MRSTNGRADILHAARTTFARKGYDGASIRDIAQEAGLSLSALYYYFPSKQDALFELILTSFDRFLQNAHEVVAAAGDNPRVQLDQLIRYVVRYRIGNPESSQVALRETEKLADDQFAAVRRKQKESNDLFRAVVAAGIDAGHFRTPFPNEAVRSVVAFCNAIPLWYRTDGAVTPEQLEDRLTHFSFRIVECDEPPMTTAGIGTIK